MGREGLDETHHRRRVRRQGRATQRGGMLGEAPRDPVQERERRGRVGAVGEFGEKREARAGLGVERVAAERRDEAVGGKSGLGLVGHGEPPGDRWPSPADRPTRPGRARSMTPRGRGPAIGYPA